jgi:hypothetical protein
LLLSFSPRAADELRLAAGSCYATLFALAPFSIFSSRHCADYSFHYYAFAEAYATLMIRRFSLTLSRFLCLPP